MLLCFFTYSNSQDHKNISRQSLYFPFSDIYEGGSIFPIVVYLFPLQEIHGCRPNLHRLCLSFLVGLYGVLFEKHKEAAFANYRLWESFGFVIAFGYSTKLQVYIKLYILLSVLVLSMVTYGAVEYLEAKSSPGTPTATKKENVEPPTQESRM